MRGLRLLIAVLVSSGLALAAGPPPLSMTEKLTTMTCTVADLGSVTLELTYATHRLTPEPFATGVEALRQDLERPPVVHATGDELQSGSWRIVRTSFAPDSFFGSRTQRACSQGCAMHEATGIDVRSTLLVIAAASNADIQADLEFSRRRELYGAAPHAKLTYVGNGDWQGFVAELPGSGQSRASCHW